MILEKVLWNNIYFFINDSSSIELFYKIEDLRFDCPTIAKPQTVGGNFFDYAVLHRIENVFSYNRTGRQRN